ncbi:hypothetical protein Dimus_017853 [Dionaea muscipula]
MMHGARRCTSSGMLGARPLRLVARPSGLSLSSAMPGSHYGGSSASFSCLAVGRARMYSHMAGAQDRHRAKPGQASARPWAIHCVGEDQPILCSAMGCTLPELGVCIGGSPSTRRLHGRFSLSSAMGGSP